MARLGKAVDLRRGTRIIGLLAVIAAIAGPTSSMSFGPFELPVGVEERPGLVRLRVHVPADVPDSSVEVEVRGRRLVVFCRNRDGLPMRSREIPVTQAVSAVDAEVDFTDDGTLIVTLRAARDGGP